MQTISTTSGKRLDWIDALRGMAILFVVYGHCIPKGDFNIFFVITSAIKMPLFFIISGFCFHSTGISTQHFFKKTLLRLVIPWIVLGFLPYIFVTPIKGLEYLLCHFKWFITGSIVWFMPCFILGSIIFYFTTKLSEGNTLILITLVISIIGYLFSKFGILNVLMINRALGVQLFFLFGYLLKRHINRIHGSIFTIISLLCYVFLCTISYLFFPNKCMDIHTGYYYNIAICLALIFSGNFFLFKIAPIIKHYPQAITSIGKNTLQIYLLSGWISALFNLLYTKLGISITSIPLKALCETIFIIACCMSISILTNKYVPFISGRENK